MPIQVFWDENDPAILRWDVSGKWTLEEFRQATKTSQKMTAAYPGTFELIILGNSYAPSSLMVDFSTAFANASPKMRIMVMVNTGEFARTLIGILQNLNTPNTEPERIFYATSLDEAYQRVRESRKLPGNANQG